MAYMPCHDPVQSGQIFFHFYLLKSFFSHEFCYALSLIVSDLEDLLRDYFELKGRPALFIAKQGSGYVVNVQAQAIRVKPFGVLPKE